MRFIIAGNLLGLPAISVPVTKISFLLLYFPPNAKACFLFAFMVYLLHDIYLASYL